MDTDSTTHLQTQTLSHAKRCICFLELWSVSSGGGGLTIGRTLWNLCQQSFTKVKHLFQSDYNLNVLGNFFVFVFVSMANTEMSTERTVNDTWDRDKRSGPVFFHFHFLSRSVNHQVCFGCNIQWTSQSAVSRFLSKGWHSCAPHLR